MAGIHVDKNFDFQCTYGQYGCKLQHAPPPPSMTMWSDTWNTPDRGDSAWVVLMTRIIITSLELFDLC